MTKRDEQSVESDCESGMRLHRRRLVAGAGVGLAGFAAARGWSGQSVAQEVGTPIASPSPGASPVATPGGPPVPEPALTIITEQRPEYAEPPVAGGELRLFVRRLELLGFNPASFRQDFQVTVSYLDPLVRAEEVTMEPVPWLAEAWEWRDSGRELVFTLREGVRWHDGTPLRPEDVCFSLFVYRDDYDSTVAAFLAGMRTCVPEGARTVRVLFDEPDGAFLFNVATLPVFQRAQYTTFWDGQPLGERSLSGFNWNAQLPVGTGPWRLDAANPDVVRLVRNEEYWAGPPSFDTLSLTAEDEFGAQLTAWRAGEVDVVWPVRPRALAGLDGVDGLVYAADSAVAMFAAFNFINSARVVPDMLVIPEVREALNLAVDRAGYAEDVFRGFVAAERTGTVAQPWAHDDDVAHPRRSVNRANRLLDELGWVDVDGDGIRDTPWGEPLVLTCIVRDDARAELLSLLQGVAEDFEQIGAALDIQRLDFAAFADRWMVSHDFDLIAYALVNYPAFAEFDLYGSAWDIRTNPRGWNPGGYVNETADEAVADYLAAYEQEDMAAALARLQRAVNDDLFALWFGFPLDLVLVRPDLRGFRPNKLHQTLDTRLMWRAGVDSG